MYDGYATNKHRLLLYMHTNIGILLFLIEIVKEYFFYQNRIGWAMELILFIILIKSLVKVLVMFFSRKIHLD